MLKRSIMIVTLLSGMVPMAAYAGNVSTRVMTAGGTATMGTGTAQTSANGTVTKFFGTGKYWNTSGVLVPQVDAGTTVAFAPNAAAGYVVSEVKLNGVVQPLTSPVTVPAAAKGQSVTIKFARQTVAVTANAAAGGSVIPGGTKSGIVGTPLTYVFTPFAGASVQSIAGLPSGATLTDPKNALATVAFPYAGPVAVTFTPVAGTNVTMTPSFLAITASAGSAKSVATGASVTLAGTSSAADATFVWTQVGGPALGTPWTASIAAPTVTLAVAGNYTFQVVATSVTAGVSAPSAVIVTAVTNYVAPSVSQTARIQCENCHSAQGVGAGIFSKYSSSIHGQSTHSLCSACHYGTTTGSHPGTVNATSVNPKTMIVAQNGVVGGSNVAVAQGAIFCTACHTTLPHDTNFNAGFNCVGCHTSSTGQGGTGDAHQLQAPSCVGCHSVAQTNPFSDKSLVSDNNAGVRAILGENSEFAKRSHHIFNGVGVKPADGQCIACHLEGDISTYGGVEVNGAYHMADTKIHLRNAHDDTDFSWDPAAATSTDLSNMDNFCMSCHSATGATSPMSAKIQANLNKNPAFVGAPLATATNPFGDLVSNSYDKQSRVNVVDVNGQFNTSNASHHAVKGKRYTTRSSASAIAAWQNYSTGGGHSTDTADQGRPSGSFNSSKQKTLYDGNLMGFNGIAGTKYTPLDTALAGTTIGDDSQLHCGDCHTVGQWKAGSSTNADGTATGAAIGAHGSNNEYMLRNSKGTDALHGLGTFICFNCHNDKAGGNTSGGYYATAYWNGTTWVSASANQHVAGIHLSASSPQYGGSSGCVGSTAGLTFTGYTSATHNTVSFASSFATTTKTNSFADLTGDSTFVVTTQSYGAQYVTFDSNGNVVMAYTVGAPNGAVGNYLAGASGNGVSGAYDANGTATSGWTGAGRTNFVNGNILGIGCMNCHNVGRDNKTNSGAGFGGIHGGGYTYTTGYSAANHGAGTGALTPVGETQTTYRFMPGNGNYGYAPIGSNITNGTTTNGTRAVSGKAAWESWNGVGTSATGGCYTNDYANQNAGWSGCNHHGNAGQIPYGASAMAPANTGTGDAPTKSAGGGNVGRTLNY